MTPKYDFTQLSKRLAEWQPLTEIKATMLEAIANIAVAVKNGDADRALAIQSELMWCYNFFDKIKEVER